MADFPSIAYDWDSGDPEIVEGGEQLPMRNGDVITVLTHDETVYRFALVWSAIRADEAATLDAFYQANRDSQGFTFDAKDGHTYVVQFELAGLRVAPFSASNWRGRAFLIGKRQ